MVIIEYFGGLERGHQHQMRRVLGQGIFRGQWMALIKFEYLGNPEPSKGEEKETLAVVVSSCEIA